MASGTIVKELTKDFASYFGDQVTSSILNVVASGISLGNYKCILRCNNIVTVYFSIIVGAADIDYWTHLLTIVPESLGPSAQCLGIAIADDDVEELYLYNVSRGITNIGKLKAGKTYLCQLVFPCKNAA